MNPYIKDRINQLLARAEYAYAEYTKLSEQFRGSGDIQSAVWWSGNADRADQRIKRLKETLEKENRS